MARPQTPEPNTSKSSVINPLRLIINISIPFFIVLLLLYTGITIYGAYLSSRGVSDPSQIQVLQVQLVSTAAAFWDFIRPFLQILIILTIISWFLDKLGISLSSKDQRLDWNVQTVIAVVVTTSFSIAALSGISEGASLLKDLALVVVGFYFGSQRRDVYDSQGRLKLSEVHINDILEQQAKLEQARRLSEQGQEKDEDLTPSPSNQELTSSPQKTDVPTTRNEPQLPTDAS